MTTIGQAARLRSARIREELAKRGQVETRVEHHETFDLAEGDRERIELLEQGEQSIIRRMKDLDAVQHQHANQIDALQKGMAELSNRLETLQVESSANATVPLVQADDGSLAARVGQIEEFIIGMPELYKSIEAFGEMVHALGASERRHSKELMELRGRLREAAHLIDGHAQTLNLLAEGG